MADTTTTTTTTAPVQSSYKQIYRPYEVPQKDGQYYQVLLAPKDYTPDYPYIDTPIPASLQGKVAKWDWQFQQWVDSKDDPVAQEVAALATSNAALTKQLATSIAALAATQQIVQALKAQLAPATTTAKA